MMKLRNWRTSSFYKFLEFFNGLKNYYSFFFINMDVRISLSAPWLILRVMKLTTM